MRILWVEDEQLPEWVKGDDEFSLNGTHFGTRIKSSKEAIKYIEGNLDSHIDAVILDIDLSADADESNKETSKKGGFKVYNRLIEMGFPRKRIIFYSANAASSIEPIDCEYEKIIQSIDGYISSDDKVLTSGELAGWKQDFFQNESEELREIFVDPVFQMIEALLPQPSNEIEPQDDGIDDCIRKKSDIVSCLEILKVGMQTLEIAEEAENDIFKNVWGYIVNTRCKTQVEESPNCRYIETELEKFPASDDRLIDFIRSQVPENEKHLIDLWGAIDTGNQTHLVQILRSESDENKGELIAFLSSTPLVGQDIGWYVSALAKCKKRNEKSLDTYHELANHYQEALMEIPKAINKSESDEVRKEITTWLDDDLDSDYIKLRRGIIDACDYLSSDEVLKNVNVALKGFSIKDKKRLKILERTNTDEAKNEIEKIKDEHFESFNQSIKDKLFELRRMLPIIEPTDKNKPLLLKRMARAVVHDWESYDPSNAIKYPKKITVKAQWRDDIVSYGYILKKARNWLIHDSRHNMEVTEKLIAFLFILHMRSVFKLNRNQVEDYENALLKLFESSEIKEEGLKRNIKQSYKDIFDNNLDSSGYFLDLADARHRVQEDRGDNQQNGLNYSCILFQSFFHAMYSPWIRIDKKAPTYETPGMNCTISFVASAIESWEEELDSRTGESTKKPKWRHESFKSYLFDGHKCFSDKLFKYFYGVAFPIDEK